MMRRVETGHRGDEDLPKAPTAKECTSSSGPDGCVMRLGDVKSGAQSLEVLQRNRGTKWPTVHNTFLVGSHPSQLDPVVIAIPGGMVDKVPVANTR
jgi:hypothetical protein